jgi:hypothetical protein
MFFNRPGTSSEQTEKLIALADTVVGEPRNSDALENFCIAWNDTATDESDPRLPTLPNQKELSSLISINAGIGDPPALLTAILMLETPDTDWGMSREKLALNVREGIRNDTGEILGIAAGILNGNLSIFQNTREAEPVPPITSNLSDLAELDKNIFKLAEALHPKKLLEPIVESLKLNELVNKFLNDTRLTFKWAEVNNSKIHKLEGFGEREILNFLNKWINSSTQEDGSINLINVPRQKEVTDRIIWLCRTGTKEGQECAMIVSKLLAEPGLIRNNGVISKNAEWVLRALREYVSVLIEEEASEGIPLPRVD